jgi:hypothetical protein
VGVLKAILIRGKLDKHFAFEYDLTRKLSNAYPRIPELSGLDDLYFSQQPVAALEAR